MWWREQRQKIPLSCHPQCCVTYWLTSHARSQLYYSVTWQDIYILISVKIECASHTLLRLPATQLDFQFSRTVAATPIASILGGTPSRPFHTTSPCFLCIVLSHDKIQYYDWSVVVSRCDEITCNSFFELPAIGGNWPSFSRSTPVHRRDCRCDCRRTTGIAAVYG